MTQVISASEFINVVANTTAATIKLHTATPVKMKKTNNPLINKEVVKDTTGVYVFNQSYKDLVEQFAGVENFNPHALAWGEWVENSNYKVISHKGKFYLRYYNNINIAQQQYMVNGKAASEEEIAIINLMSPKKSMSKTQESVGLTEKTMVRVQNVCFDNIKSAYIGGIEYVIE